DIDDVSYRFIKLCSVLDFKDYFSSNAKAVAKVNIYYLVIEFFKVNIQEICVELNIENEFSKRLHYL
ncbi:hypothetical protein BU111_06340, partial [Staphylococcus xylosus]|uniref:hypothetical protein n=1 Tax=Staphylococcus xylosus TaxID=1288 RepID=UPI000D4300AC